MKNNKLYNKDYTQFNGYYQLTLPLNLEILIPKDDSVRLLVKDYIIKIVNAYKR